MTVEEIDAQIRELTKKRNEEQSKIDEAKKKEAEERQKKLMAEKDKRKKEVQDAYDKYIELADKYDSDYCSNVRMDGFPFRFFEL